MFGNKFISAIAAPSGVVLVKVLYWTQLKRISPLNDLMLYEKQQAVKAAFDAKAVEKTQKETEVEDIVTEMNRLQGEYRLLEKLRGEIKPEATQPSDPAATLPADPLKRETKAKSGK